MASGAGAGWLRRDAAWIAAGAAALAALAYAFVTVFGTPENMAAPTFGTAWAPYSDSLGPWLEGGLSFLFGYAPPAYLYRPTIGVFWASILGTTGRIEMIPMLFAGWLLTMLAAAVLMAEDRRVRNAVVVGMALVALGFAQTWHLLYISSTNVDLPALAVTSTGLLLLLWGRGSGAHAALLVGCACLGIAAAIRGPMMLAGIVIIAARVLLVERTSGKVIAAGIALFLLPLAVEMGLQRHLGTINNGLMAIYCFYSDPAHAWTPDCNTAFLARKPGGAQILVEYVQYLLTLEGASGVGGGLKWRVARDLAPATQAAALAVLLAAGALASWSEKGFARAAGPSPFLRAIALVGALAALRWFGGSYSAIALVLVALAAAAAFRLWATAMCLAGYLAATLYLCLLGLHGGDRLQHTFSFALYVGLGLLLMETAHPALPRAGRALGAMRQAIPAAAALAIVFLYLGNSVLPSSMRQTYESEVRGRADVAIKLGEDARIDRSLYYTGQRALFYTADDVLAVGCVRKFGKLASDRTGNVSFVQPNAFAD